MEPSTIDLSILKAALEAGGLLRPMNDGERMCYGYANNAAKIAVFQDFTFIDDDDGLYLDQTADNSNGFNVIATKSPYLY